MSTLTIRLPDETRAELEVVARRRGVGVSSLLRQLAEDEIRRARRDEILTAWEPVMAHIASSPEARAELDDYGVPASDPV